MIEIKRKFSEKELNLLKCRLDRRGGMVKAAKKTGIHRETIRRVMISGVCNEKTASIIREKLLS